MINECHKILITNKVHLCTYECYHYPEISQHYIYQNFQLKFQVVRKELVLISFPVAIIKYFDKSHLREKAFIWLTVPSYGPSLPGRQNGRNLKQLVTLHPWSRAESSESVHVLVLDSLCPLQYSPEEGVGSPGNGVRRVVSYHVDAGN